MNFSSTFDNMHNTSFLFKSVQIVKRHKTDKPAQIKDRQTHHVHSIAKSLDPVLIFRKTDRQTDVGRHTDRQTGKDERQTDRHRS